MSPSLASSPITTPPLTSSALQRQMGLVAAVDRRLSQLAADGLIAAHQRCDGEEAVLVGLSAALTETDWVFWGRQVLVPALMRGLPLAQLFAFAGVGSSATAARAEIASLKIVAGPHGAAARLPHATGLAWAARKDNVVAVCELGDGSVSDGDFHCGVNFAGVMNAPVVFVVRTQGVTAVADRAEGYGIRGLRIAGDDPDEVRAAVSEQIERARRGEGPALIEASVQRGRRLPVAQTAAHEDTVGAALAAWDKLRSQT
jgi:TPP-dependent pyruvate/acetoin dehydrogenase alpha subunit